MSLKDMTLDELQEGYEKGKVTDEEIEQHLLERIHKEVRKAVKVYSEFQPREDLVIACSGKSKYVNDTVNKLAEHEYQKLKDNEN